MVVRRRALARALVLALLAAFLIGPPAGTASAATLPAGFTEQTVFSGLTFPTNMEFAPDGRVFVAEKRGVIKVYDGLTDSTPTVFADLSTAVNEYWDRGLLALALPPNFPDDPWVYVGYTYDAPPGQSAPVHNDTCPDGQQCVVTARVSRLQAAGNAWTGTEQVLIHDWCQQFPSHSIGNLEFGPDGALYVTGGDGASFGATDYGQLGNPTVNPCGDPPGGAMAAPGAEGGALRTQDVRTGSDPTGLNGALLRVDPATGAAMPDNPVTWPPDANARRIIAYGMRNPFRFAFRPGTDEVWVGDVGWRLSEEINVVRPAGPAENFGWPCYEGTARQPSYDAANLTLCESLYLGGGQVAPRFAWQHNAGVYPGDPCPFGGSSAISGLAFYPAAGGSYPAAYRSGLFFADYSRNCVWVMKAPAPGSAPNSSTVEAFDTGAAAPVDLEVGPNGELYYVDIAFGSIRRYRYFASNQPPDASLAATPTDGPAPLEVTFDASASTDPNPADQSSLTFAWDFTDDGSVDSTAAVVDHTYPAGTYTARLTVTDPHGASDTGTVVVTSGNTAPTAVMTSPSAGTTWRAGQTITFAGAGTDPDDGSLPASALSWQLRLQHCGAPTTCHVHVVQEWTGVAGGEFVAPDHDYPAYLELELRVTDPGGLARTVVRRLDPRTVNLTFQTNPPGRELVADNFAAATPFTRTVIQGSQITVSAPSPQLGASAYTFTGWSDDLARTHTITAPTADATLTASFLGSNVTNIARNRPILARATCATSSGPAKAVNGSWTLGPSDRWCSPGPSTWIQVDLGSVRLIRGIVLRHAGAGGESSALNTRDYSIRVSGTLARWTTVVAETGNSSDVTAYPANTYARYVRVDITGPSNNGSSVARLYELEVLAGA